MITMATSKALLDPTMGQVLGVSWGCTAADLRAVYPELTPERDEPDVRTYSLAQFPVGGDLRARCVFTFWLDELVSVEFSLPGATAADMDTAARPLLDPFPMAAQTTDVGLLRTQEGRTRIEIDRLDARIRLEEIPT